MTREDDIRERLANDKAAGYWPTYYDTISYLLASNEELQRRVSELEKAQPQPSVTDAEVEAFGREIAKMQAVVDAAKDVVGEAADDLDGNKGKCSISSYQIKDLERAIKRLDVKEQDDAKL